MLAAHLYPDKLHTVGMPATGHDIRIELLGFPGRAENFQHVAAGGKRQHERRDALRMAVDAAVIPGEESQPGGRLTVSVGVATLAGGHPRTLKGRADEALYEAKAQGRNRCVTS